MNSIFIPLKLVTESVEPVKDKVGVAGGSNGRLVEKSSWWVVAGVDVARG